MGELKSRKGSLTVEAAITLPVFICVIISIAFFMKVVYVQEIIQHSISEAANEISTYSYFYSISGAQKLHDETAESLASHKEVIERQVGMVVDTADSLSEKLKDTKAVFKEISQNPKGEAKSLALAFARAGMEDMKADLVLKPLIKALIVKYLQGKSSEDVDKRLVKLNVVGGFEGLDFSESRLFEDTKHIDVIVRYKVKLGLPINVLPELNLIQRARVRAWLDGEVNVQEVVIKENIWELSDFERGKRIQEIYGRNLPYNFKTITKFEDGSGIATLVTSINLNSGNYQKDCKSLGDRINASIKRLTDFENDTKTCDEKGKTICYYVDKNHIKQRKLVVVIPKGSKSQKFEEVFERCRKEARTKGVEVVIEEL